MRAVEVYKKKRTFNFWVELLKLACESAGLTWETYKSFIRQSTDRNLVSLYQIWLCLPGYRCSTDNVPFFSELSFVLYRIVVPTYLYTLDRKSVV